MVRKQVENIRGLILTPEELWDVIIPVVITSLERYKLSETDNENTNPTVMNGAGDTLQTINSFATSYSPTDKMLWDEYNTTEWDNLY